MGNKKNDVSGFLIDLLKIAAIVIFGYIIAKGILQAVG
jgi:hypothetical protein